MQQKEMDKIQNTVAQRGIDLIQFSGKPSFGSTALAILDHLRDWHFGTQRIVSVALESEKENEYGIPEGLVFSYPCTCENGEWKIVKGLKLNENENNKVKQSISDLVEEL